MKTLAMPGVRAGTEGELRRARKVRVHGVLARLPERRRVDRAVVGAEVGVVEHVEHFCDPGQFQGTQPDVFRHAHVHFMERLAFERIARRDLARRDDGRAVVPIGDRGRNRERGAAVVAVGAGARAERVQPDGRRIVVPRSEEVRARHRDVPRQAVDAARAKRVPLELGRPRPVGRAIELVVRLRLEAGRVVVRKEHQRVRDVGLKVVPEASCQP